MNKSFTILALAIFLFGLMTPVFGISLDFNAINDGTRVSSSGSYNLDRSALLQESAAIGNGEVSKNLIASGSGNNRILISSSTKEKTADIEIESSGNFQTSASAGASGEGVGVSQETTMTGSHGGITAHSDSPENNMVISSGFDGEGDLTAGISSAAGDNAAISGNVNALGVDMLDSDSLQALSSGDIELSVDGLYSQPNGDMGNFGLSAANTKKGIVGSDTSALLTGPAYTASGGNANAYTLYGYRWNTKDPQLKWVLKNDANMAAEGLSTTAVQSAISGASNTWDDATNQNLFADSSLVTLNPTVATETYNKINTINWKPIGSSCLGYTRTYYNLDNIGGYHSALDSDIVFNSDYSWRTDGSWNGVDVQSTALHEMGHTLGLGDIYGLTQFKSDTNQVMHYYTGVKRTLGNGDKTGVWNLYK
ncbi:MAG: matrixin family metalloprotease [Methanothrix sp.]|nr:matrixin family metalloprotease [Methanothrix sp.]